MIKPEFFDDPDIAELSPYARLAFIGMWLQADREGRLIEDLRRLKARIFPYDPVDMEALAAELHAKNMIRRYSAEKKPGETGQLQCYIWIRTFSKHQRPHLKEPESLIPPYSIQAEKKPGEPGQNPEGCPLESNGSFILDPLESKGDGDAEKPGASLTSTASTPTNGNGAHTGPAPLFGRTNIHKNHACCGKVCLHCTQFEAFMQLASAKPDADAYVRAFFGLWHNRYMTGDRRDEIIGEDSFEFWRNRWAETHPTKKGRAKVDDVEARTSQERQRAEIAKGEARRKSVGL